MGSDKEAVLNAASDYIGQIKPYRLSKMIKTAGQIMDMMVKSDFGVSFTECLVILDIVRESILAVNDKEE